MATSLLENTLTLNGVNLINIIYPVGSYYITESSEDPSTTFGKFGISTTWSKVQNVFLLGSGTRNVGSIGGEETHTLTVDEIPSHNHNILVNQNQGGNSNNTCADAYPDVNKRTPTEYTGGGQPHNNMPPYRVVNLYRRET